MTPRAAPPNADTAGLLRLLQRGCAEMELALTDHQQRQLIAYLELMVKWNRAYNLTAVRDPEAMVGTHLLDSLSVVPFVKAERVIDVGTGGGLPGIPLAIVYPERHFTLLDSNGKKTRFLFQVKQSLKLTNIEVVHSRVEQYRPADLFDGIISRAFASIRDMIDGCEHLLAPGGRFYVMKGIFPEGELSELEKHYIVVASHPLKVPAVDGERCLLEICRHLAEEPLQSIT